MKHKSIFFTIVMLLVLATGVAADGVCIETSEAWNNYNGEAIEAYPLVDGSLAYVSIGDGEITLAVNGDNYDESQFPIHQEYLKSVLVTGCGKKITAVVNYDFSAAPFPPLGPESQIFTWTLMESLASCARSTVYIPAVISEP